MYLYIFEDGSVQQSTVIHDDYLQECDDGVLDIIDISDPNNPLQYWEGDWHLVEKET